jgi:molybdate transport system substrate-binding protein
LRLKRLLAGLLSLPLAVVPSVAANAAGTTVFAAASLKDALDDAARRFDAETGNRTTISYGASSALARQIEHGAPADIFVSADAEWMDYLAERRLIRTASRVNLLSNRLVLISPAASAIRIRIEHGFPLAGTLGRERLAMADPDHVPAGKYGRAALESLGVWASVSGKIARSENVRAALVLVARGEAPLGIVYRTDALAERKVRIVDEFPVLSHARIVYPAALTAASRSAAALGLLAFLRAPAVRAIWLKYGFTVLD